MGFAATLPKLTGADYLRWDLSQAQRSEFVGGEIFMMAGAGEAHVTVALNVAMALRQHLSGTPCRTFITDMKLRVEAADAYFYPDLMITCSEQDAKDPMIKREPLLLIEVLSPSTAAYDRGDKFAVYRMLPSLQEVALIDPDSRRCDVYRKGSDGLWVLHPVEPQQTLQLASVDLAITAEQLWAEVPPPEPRKGLVPGV